MSSAVYCAYCGLPVRGLWGSAPPKEGEPDYCCTGCRVAAGIAAAPEGDAAVRGQLVRTGLAIFFTMNVVVFTMELWSQDVYSDPAHDSPFALHLRAVFQWASLVFAAPVLLLLGGPIVKNVWHTLRRGAITTDVLILLGVAASYLYSAISVMRGAGAIYFEVGCVVLVLLSLGRWLEARGKHRTGAALDHLARMLPATVRDRPLSPGVPVEEIPRDEIIPGDVVRVLPGERIPVDGCIAVGRATLDEQIVTGESRPVVRGAGDAVSSGVVNLDGDLWIRVSAAAGADLVSRMLDLVREARRSRGRYERLADRIAAWFVPAVCVIALATAVIHAQRDGVDRGVLTGLAVVLIACPCALGLATPMAVWTAMGRAADERVLFRSGEVLERLAAVDVVCFDKTGTITDGAAAVRQLRTADGVEPGRVLAVAARLAGGSLHGYSRAITEYAAQYARPNTAASAACVEFAYLQTCAGRGVAAIDASDSVVAALGSPRWLDELRMLRPGSLGRASGGDHVHSAVARAARDGL
ncbi:MAG TPA: HAD-IC family P-type ATPase, partial [Lacipirellulaceae bacterium]|nr:HAD-IC family P-type ATPase [Lacipirellulaceae bacterium]